MAATIFGFLMGFGFGCGCALAVMYSIYMGGYRKAVEESLMPKPPERFTAAVRRVQARASM